ncbi:hypothetical protein NE237_031241 [Protea cynaroides]|uniref:CASP-like protein n=1 Tax=Protea cynaroides TaxID=273540 RepID=A0A9Q0L155_9MAGN|nr:hypothetical protein NE237_031241 [Protea cynaroides]
MDNSQKYFEISSEAVSFQLQTVDLFLRFSVFATSLAALLVMGISKETVLTETTELKFFPALIYFEVALCVAGFYAIITLIISFKASGKASPSKFLLCIFAVFDALMIVIVGSATGASAAFGYVGLNGNAEMGWMKMCDVYNEFCRHIAAATAVSLADCIILVMLVFSSAYSLYRLSSPAGGRISNRG